MANNSGLPRPRTPMLGPPVGAAASSIRMLRFGSATLTPGSPCRVLAAKSSAPCISSRCVSICCCRSSLSVTPPTACAAAAEGPAACDTTPICSRLTSTCGWAAGPVVAPAGATNDFIMLLRKDSISEGMPMRRAASDASDRSKSVRPARASARAASIRWL